MRIVRCQPDHPEVSEFGEFRLVLDPGWVNPQSFIDFESGLLIVSVRSDEPDRKVNGMSFWTPKIHVFDADSLEELSSAAWSEYFDYEQTTVRSADGRFDLVRRRVLGEDGESDKFEQELIAVATGESVATGRGVAFGPKPFDDLLQSYLVNERRRNERAERLAAEVEAGTAQRCPRCDAPVHTNGRYPDYLCADCAALEKVDEQGRIVTFGNVSFSGGFSVSYWENGEVSSVDNTMRECVCFIEGRRYIARERRFGGVVIRPDAANAGLD